MKRPTDLCANRRCRHPRSAHGLRYRSVMLGTCRLCAEHPHEGPDGDLYANCYRFEEAR